MKEELRKLVEEWRTRAPGHRHLQGEVSMNACANDLETILSQGEDVVEFDLLVEIEEDGRFPNLPLTDEECAALLPFKGQKVHVSLTPLKESRDGG